MFSRSRQPSRDMEAFTFSKHESQSNLCIYAIQILCISFFNVTTRRFRFCVLEDLAGVRMKTSDWYHESCVLTHDCRLNSSTNRRLSTGMLWFTICDPLKVKKKRRGWARSDCVKPRTLSLCMHCFRLE